MGAETPGVEDLVRRAMSSGGMGVSIATLGAGCMAAGGGQMLPPLELAAVLLHVPGFLGFLEKAGVLVPGLVFVKNA